MSNIQLKGSNDKHLLRKAREEKAKRLLWERYRKEPLYWLEHRFGENPIAFQWSLWESGYINHIWDGDVDPLAKAWQDLADGFWAAVQSATGTGKTFWLARVVFWYLDCFENSLVVTTAPKESQLKLHLWTEIARAFNKFKRIRPHAELLSLRLVVDARKSEGQTQIDDHIAGWQAIGFVAGVGSNEESATKAQGFHRDHMLIIVEETPGVGSAIMTAFENTSTGENNKILCVGNPDYKNDTLYNFSVSPDVKATRISSMDFPNVVLNKDVVKGAVTVGSINRRIKKYGKGSNLVKSRVHGLFPEQAVDSLIRLEWLHNAIEEQADDWEVYTGKGAVGIDVAQSENGDKAALAGGKGNVLLYLQEFQCENATDLAYNLLYDNATLEKEGYNNYDTFKLIDLDVAPNFIGIDTVGPGVATANAFNERLRKVGKVVGLSGGALKDVIPKDAQGKPLYEFGSLRAQMYWEAREDLREGKVKIALADKTVLEELFDELIIIKFTPKGSKIVVESKDEIKKRIGRSPDKADAFVYWNWIRKHYYKLQKNTTLSKIGLKSR